MEMFLWYTSCPEKTGWILYETIPQKKLWNYGIKLKLSQEQQDELNKNITPLEIESSLKLMNNNKSPGPEGVIVEFYKEFWYIIGDDLSYILINGLDNNQLTYSQYLALMIRLYKKESERT